MLTLPSDQLKQAPAIRTRTVLPALTSIKFDCVICYAEDLVARIDCPRRNSIDLYPRDDPPVDLQVSQVYKFIKRSEDPLLTGFDSVCMRGCQRSLHRPPNFSQPLSLHPDFHLSPSRKLATFIHIPGGQPILPNALQCAPHFYQFFDAKSR